MLNGNKWNDMNWEWEQSLLNLRQLISNKNNNIFVSQKNNVELRNEIKVTNLSLYVQSKSIFSIYSKSLLAMNWIKLRPI